MTLQQLRYALTIAGCGSMNEAAKRLFLSQPSLSETVKELEQEIGLQIFMRSNRGKGYGRVCSYLESTGMSSLPSSI